MVRWIALILTGVLAVGTANASAEFNSAWRAYRTAVEEGDKAAELTTSTKVVELGRAMFAGDDERLPVLINNHAVALLRNGQSRLASTYFDEAYTLAKTIHDDESEAVLVLVRTRAEVLDAERDWDEAHRWYKRALGLTRKVYPTDSVEYAEQALQLGAELGKRSPNTGIAILKEAGEIYSANDAISDLGVVKYYIARIELGRGKRSRATKIFEEALTLLDPDVPLAKARSLAIRAALVPLYERRGDSEKATEHCVAIGRDSKFADDQDYLPLYRMAPAYPPTLLRSGVQGYVDLEFTVDKSGIVRNVQATRVVHTGQSENAGALGPESRMSRRQRLFADAARAAVERFRYAPRFVNGEPVETAGVATRIGFEIAN
ncbi:MAG: tetratricopeptide repeat protein [Pseudomonadota bacterium]